MYVPDTTEILQCSKKKNPFVHAAPRVVIFMIYKVENKHCRVILFAPLYFTVHLSSEFIITVLKDFEASFLLHQFFI